MKIFNSLEIYKKYKKSVQAAATAKKVPPIK